MKFLPGIKEKALHFSSHLQNPCVIFSAYRGTERSRFCRHLWSRCYLGSPCISVYPPHLCMCSLRKAYTRVRSQQRSDQCCKSLQKVMCSLISMNLCQVPLKSKYLRGLPTLNIFTTLNNYTWNILECCWFSGLPRQSEASSPPTLPSVYVFWGHGLQACLPDVDLCVLSGHTTQPGPSSSPVKPGSQISVKVKIKYS